MDSTIYLYIAGKWKQVLKKIKLHLKAHTKIVKVEQHCNSVSLLSVYAFSIFCIWKFFNKALGYDNNDDCKKNYQSNQLAYEIERNEKQNEKKTNKIKYST